MTPAWRLIDNRRAAYRRVFGTLEGQKVLADLVKFCRGNESCFHPDPRVHAALEGRREVLLRIVKHLAVPLDQLAREYGAVEWLPEAKDKT